MKKAVVYLALALCCCLFFLYSASAVEAAKGAFALWRDCVLPSLLPFSVCAYVLQRMGAPSRMEQVSLTVLCLLSGAPAGAQFAGDGENTDSRTVAILNLVSPMFIYGSFCTGMLGSPALAAPILLAQFAAAGLMLLLFPPAPVKARQRGGAPLALLAEGMRRSMPAMLNICASMIFFMALTAALSQAADRLFPSPSHMPVLSALVSGALEMVSGCAELARLALPPRQAAACAAFFFSFGGVCIFAQSLTFCPLSPGRYFSTKLIQGLLAALLAYAITPLFPGAVPVYRPASVDTLVRNALSFGLTAGAALVAMSAVLMMGAAARHKKR